MNIEKIKSEISNLAIAEKLMLIEDVWDEIAMSNQALSLPEWQKKELDKRLALYREEKVETKSSSQVHEDLRNKYS